MRGGAILPTGKAFLIGGVRCQNGVGEKPWRYLGKNVPGRENKYAEAEKYFRNKKTKDSGAQ